MQFPLTFWDISLLLAIIGIILLATAELTSPYYGRTNLIIEKRRLRQAALLIGILFMITVAIKVYGIITSP